MLYVAVWRNTGFLLAEYEVCDGVVYLPGFFCTDLGTLASRGGS